MENSLPLGCGCTAWPLIQMLYVLCSHARNVHNVNKELKKNVHLILQFMFPMDSPVLVLQGNPVWHKLKVKVSCRLTFIHKTSPLLHLSSIIEDYWSEDKDREITPDFTNQTWKCLAFVPRCPRCSLLWISFSLLKARRPFWIIFSFSLGWLLCCYTYNTIFFIGTVSPAWIWI